MPLLAPNINSYRRLRRWSTAPINVHWGIENRTVGLRVPISSPEARRVENRIAGADANPYLAMAATLACGWLGIIGEIEPSDPIKGTAYRLAQTLPQQMPEALRKLQQSGPLKEVLGEDFVEVLLAVKQTEHDAYQQRDQLLGARASAAERVTCRQGRIGKTLCCRTEFRLRSWRASLMRIFSTCLQRQMIDYSRGSSTNDCAFGPDCTVGRQRCSPG